MRARCFAPPKMRLRSAWRHLVGYMDRPSGALFCIAMGFRSICLLSLWCRPAEEGSLMGGDARRLAMTQWDVFSSRALEGNSLAVFLDATGLADSEMQSIAKEMNLSETTFI
ncbi:MAG: hypothetical protein DMG97_41490, partial [Acidobacteria bacterium]